MSGCNCLSAKGSYESCSGDDVLSGNLLSVMKSNFFFFFFFKRAIITWCTNSVVE